MVVLGLCGPAGSGKTTVANYLARAYGARLFALATPLKEIVRRAFSLSHDQLYGSQEDKERIDERYNVAPRWLMQRIGTDGVRAVLGEDFWVRHTMDCIYDDPQAQLAVIEDVRFVSEAAGIREDLKWCPNRYIWKLDTPWRDSEADPTHQSESEWREVREDHRIAPSTKSLDALYLEVDRACAKFGITPILKSIEAP